MKEQYDDLVVIYSKKQDGNMALKFEENQNIAIQNKERFIKKMELDIGRFVFLNPNNEDVIVEIKENIINKDFIEADAVICPFSNIYFYLNFGDCLPFVLYDRKKHIFAFAHLGYKSITLDLHKKIYQLFINKYHSKKEDLKVYIGPCIKKESYIVENPIQREKEIWKAYIKLKEKSLYYVDLVGYVKDFFLEYLSLKQIIVNLTDTAKDINYFSHYRASHCKSEKEGRFLFGVGFKE